MENLKSIFLILEQRIQRNLIHVQNVTITKRKIKPKLLEQGTATEMVFQNTLNNMIPKLVLSIYI